MSVPASYERLPGRSQPLFGVIFLLDLVLMLGQSALAPRSRLYRGEDHLLLVEQGLFTETMRRFYLRDIQAITVRRTRRAFYLNLFLIALLVGLAATAGPALVADPAPAAVAVISAVGLFFVLLIAVNTVLGPACQTELHTAVHRQPLPNLRRWRTATDLSRQLSPLILAAQQQVGGAAETTNDGPPERTTPSVFTGEFSSGPMLYAKPALTKRFDPNLPALAFWLLLICCASSVADVFFYNNVKNLLDALLYSCTLLVGAIALGAIRQTAASDALRLMLGALIGAIIIFFYGGQFILTFDMMMSVGPEEMPDFSQLDAPTLVLQWYAGISAVCYGLIGLQGLVQLRHARRYSG